MGVIINIDEALKLRTDYNILREPLNEMIKISKRLGKKATAGYDLYSFQH